MFKIILNNCCGLDVHKTWIYACVSPFKIFCKGRLRTVI